MTRQILVTGTSLVPESVMAFMRSQGFEVSFRPKDTWTAEELDEALRGACGYIIGGEEVATAEHFERATDLEVVAWPGTDFKPNVPGWERGYELGIAFVSAPGANSNSVAEYTIGLMLILLRRFGLRFETLSTVDDVAVNGRDLSGKTVGIIGMGRVGTRVAQIAKQGFGANLLYTSRSRHLEVEDDLGAKWTDLDELLSASDIVTLHLPGRSESEPPEIGARELALMGQDSLLINTVRWNMVDLDALYSALQNNRIRGAAFDDRGAGEAWDRLVQLSWDKFVWFPSTAFNSDDANLRASMIAAKAIVEVLKGGTSPYVNNPDFRMKRQFR